MRLAITTLIAVAGIFAATTVRAAEPVYQGQFVQGGIVFGQTDAGDQVLLDGAAIDTIAVDGRFVLGFPRDYEGPAKLTIKHSDGSIENFAYDIGDREFDIQRIDGLPKKMVTPDPAVMDRIKDDSRQAREARTERFTEKFLESGFIWPALGPISGVYGSQRILNGEPRSPHWGVDIAVPTGTAVVAPADGIVTLAHPDMYFSGATLFLDHGLGMVSAFLHLSEIDVKVGDMVKQGDLIGKVGASGRATGPHLDWRINVGAARVDAQLLVPSMEDAQKAANAKN
ncbi:M23 family metallopeptidase [Thalassospira sp. GB04J01]|uniref:M23 family metallopeptidase n=1 Tax=Thalassospira sp. GB04J01 TaxID=1485225 RepID=UPI000C9A41EF|nr:M23 family metallopeptidase [Thalassospira sp. GB04J01]|tara:strand:- start:133409 stop:134260 length:852 start_codon:yes stop_codon:yes gene_type:complete